MQRRIAGDTCRGTIALVELQTVKTIEFQHAAKACSARLCASVRLHSCAPSTMSILSITGFDTAGLHHLSLDRLMTRLQPEFVCIDLNSKREVANHPRTAVRMPKNSGVGVMVDGMLLRKMHPVGTSNVHDPLLYH